MLVGYSYQDLQDWSSGMHGYQKQKRTKKPFGKQFQPLPNIVKSQEIRENQRKFNPVLQTYVSQQRQQQAKQIQSEKQRQSINRYYRTSGKRNMREFDIINLHGSSPQPESWSSKTRAPIRNIYNPINNQLIPEHYFRGKDVRLPQEKLFKDIKPEGRDFNIVTGIYFQDNQMKKSREESEKVKRIQQKYRSSHTYDKVFGRYYDDQKQKQYETQLQTNQSVEQKKPARGLPPSYLTRQPLVLDPTKPLSQSLMALDTRKQNAKQRYRLKYLIQKEYQKRNIEYEDKQQQRLLNRVHNSHSMDQKAKQFMALFESQNKDFQLERVKGDNDKTGNYGRFAGIGHYAIDNPEIKSQRSHYGNDNEPSSSSRYSQRSYLLRSSIKSGGFS